MEFGYFTRMHAQVKEEMHRSMTEVAPAFDGAHTARAA